MIITEDSSSNLVAMVTIDNLNINSTEHIKKQSDESAIADFICSKDKNHKTIVENRITHLTQNGNLENKKKRW